MFDQHRLQNTEKRPKILVGGMRYVDESPKISIFILNRFPLAMMATESDNQTMTMTIAVIT